MMFLRRKKCFLLLTVLFLGTLTLSSEGVQPTAMSGINFAGPADWNTELPFVNVFYYSRPWISQQKDKPWGKGPALDLDERGYVKSLAPNCHAESIVCCIEGGHYPAGRYHFLYDGEGEFTFSRNVKVVEGVKKPTEAGNANYLALEVDNSKGAVFIQLRKVNPKNYVKNIRFIMPGKLATFAKQPWNDAFLNRWKGVQVIRLMDLAHTNNSKIATWEERSRLDDASWSRKGIPPEVMCHLANTLNAAPWFCIPHQADDDYVRKFAKLVKQQIKPELKIYVEYSNEVWNGIFSQHKWAAQQAAKRNLTPNAKEKTWEAAWAFTAVRSVEIFKIFEEVFGGTDRLVRVLPTQAANPYVSKYILNFQNAAKHADALGVAPYMGFNIPANKAQATVALGLEGILNKVEKEVLPKSIKSMQTQKEIAQEHKLALVAYEAGQHLVGVGGGANNEQLTKLFHQANAHPRMGEFYKKYIAAWEKTGGKTLCFFSSTGKWSKWGSWGLLQYADSKISDTAKMEVVRAWFDQQK